MREARERVELNWKKENEKRRSLGLPDLPIDNFNIEVQQMTSSLFEEIKEREVTQQWMDRKWQTKYEREQEIKRMANQL